MAEIDAYPELARDLRFFPVQNDAPTTLTPAQIEQFNARGYIAPLDVYSPEEMSVHRAAFDELMEEARNGGGNGYSINGWHRTHAVVHDMVTEARILDYLQDLLGEDLVCWGTHYFCKMPGDGKRVSWHQDASYWPLTPSKTVTVWLAIDDADAKNGAMQIVPGSHLHGQIAFEQSRAEENNVLNQTVVDPLDYGGEPVLLALRAGQMSLHTDLLLHGSEPNASNRRRCGLTLRFVPAEVRALNGWNGNAVVCRGIDAEGHWQHCPRPQS